MTKEYFYKLECEDDPTSDCWRRLIGEDIGYRYVKNEGIYTNKPITDMRWMFEDTYITEFDASGWDLSSVTNMRFMFWGATSLESVTLPETGSVTDMSYMFKGATSLKSVSLPDTSNVTNMRYMFKGATSLESVSLPKTGSVTNMYGMFDGATSLTSVSLSDTSNVTDMRWMFVGATSFKQDIRDWNVSSVWHFGSMFYGATAMQEKFGVGDTPDREWFNKETKE